MKVKTTTSIIDSKNEPIMVSFDSKIEKLDTIASLSSNEENNSFIKCPENMTPEETEKFFQLKINENIDYKDKYIRLYADFENYKKRSSKDKEEAVSNTKYKILETILEIDTEMERSIKHIKDEESLKGIKLIISKLTSYLNSMGIQEINVDKYDENLHEVVSIVYNGIPDEIVDVVSKGYTLNGKVIKHPKVILSK